MREACSRAFLIQHSNCWCGLARHSRTQAAIPLPPKSAKNACSLTHSFSLYNRIWEVTLTDANLVPVSKYPLCRDSGVAI